MENAPPPPARRGPVPHEGVPFQPRLERRVTEVVPFSFCGRDAERLASKKQKLQDVREVERQVLPPSATTTTRVDTAISLMAYETRVALDTRYLRCKSSLYKLKLPIMFWKKNWKSI